MNAQNPPAQQAPIVGPVPLAMRPAQPVIQPVVAFDFPRYNPYQAGNMGRTLNELYRPTPAADQTSILVPAGGAPIDLNKGGLLNLAMRDQFYGKTNEDPNAHIERFNLLCSAVQNVPRERLKLVLFPFTLKDKAAYWLRNEPVHHFTTCAQLTREFVEEFFPPSKTQRLIDELMRFRQLSAESLYDCWTRFQELQRAVPHHNLDRVRLLKMFMDGLRRDTRDKIDNAAQGDIGGLDIDQALSLVDKIAKTSYRAEAII
jgi:hypothetical protein